MMNTRAKVTGLALAGRVLLSAALLSAWGSAAMAAAPPPKKDDKAGAEPVIKVGKTFDDWVVVCERPKDAKDEKCFAQQNQQTSDGNMVLRVSVGNIGPKGEPIMIALMPLGINLSAGAAYKIDEGDQVPFFLHQCTALGCQGAAQVKDLKALFTAKKIIIGMMPWGSSETFAIAVSPKGLKTAIDSLK